MPHTPVVRYIGSRELHRDLPKVLESLEDPSARFVLTIHSKPKAVLIGAEAFLALLRGHTPQDRLLALQLGALVQGLESSRLRPTKWAGRQRRPPRRPGQPRAPERSRRRLCESSRPVLGPSRSIRSPASMGDGAGSISRRFRVGAIRQARPDVESPRNGSAGIGTSDQRRSRGRARPWTGRRVGVVYWFT